MTTRTPLLLTLVLAACSGAEADPLPSPSDAGGAIDGGSNPDTGVERDAGPARDAGSAPDAGSVRDAGAARDAGVDPADGGTVDLAAWFADYNAGRGVAYLDAPFTTNAGGDARYPQSPTHVHYEGVAYGPFPRNELDVWRVDSATPTSLAVFIHGGGFQSGSKDSVHQNRTVIPSLLAAGVSVASISYRYAYRDPDAALEAPVPNDEGTIHDVNGTRLDYILRDCARAIQFLRYRAAEWNIDPTRIGAWGGSAGAGCSVWVGAVDDLAVADHPDPVLRESSRLAVMGHTNGQPTYDWARWPELLQLDADYVFDQVGRESTRLTQMRIDDVRFTPEGRALGAVMDYYEQLSPDDPPFMTVNRAEDRDESMITDPSQIVHHPRAHVALYRRCVAMGLRCEIATMIEDSGYRGSIVSFLIEVLTR